MDEQIKDAFAGIHADEGMKTRTMIALRAKAARGSYSKLLRPAPLLVCLVLLIFLPLGLYFTPTAVISVDINPSVELTVNRFDRVISAVGINSDGQQLLDAVKPLHLTCADAVAQLLSCESISEMLQNDCILELGIIADRLPQSQRLQSALDSLCHSRQNISCYLSDRSELDAAHDLGMSCGKYRAYAALVNAGIDITPEQAQNMPMHQLKELTPGTDSHSCRPHNRRRTGQ